jgi:hypothetical protein
LSAISATVKRHSNASRTLRRSSWGTRRTAWMAATSSSMMKPLPPSSMTSGTDPLRNAIIGVPQAENGHVRSADAKGETAVLAHVVVAIVKLRKNDQAFLPALGAQQDCWHAATVRLECFPERFGGSRSVWRALFFCELSPSRCRCSVFSALASCSAARSSNPRFVCSSVRRVASSR